MWLAARPNYPSTDRCYCCCCCRCRCFSIILLHPPFVWTSRPSEGRWLDTPSGWRLPHRIHWPTASLSDLISIYGHPLLRFVLREFWHSALGIRCSALACKFDFQSYFRPNGREIRLCYLSRRLMWYCSSLCYWECLMLFFRLWNYNIKSAYWYNISSITYFLIYKISVPLHNQRIQ